MDMAEEWIDNSKNDKQNNKTGRRCNIYNYDMQCMAQPKLYSFTLKGGIQ